MPTGSRSGPGNGLSRTFGHLNEVALAVEEACAHDVAQLVDSGIGQPVEDIFAGATAKNQTYPAQNSQVTRDVRLRKLKAAA